jgi:hypothetical protein
MVERTEREIFAEAMGIEESDIPGAPGDDYEIDGDDLEAVSGWDGQALSNDEIAYRNIYGDQDDGPLAMTDRPLALMEERHAEEREAYINELEQRIFELDEQPRQREAYEQHRQVEHDRMLFQPDEVMSEMDQMRQELQTHRQGNLARHFDEAHQAYGAEFEQAAAMVNDLANRAHAGDQHAAEQVRSIVNSPNPGYATMQYGHMMKSLSSMRPPPFAGGRGPISSRRALPARDLADQDGGWGDAGIEDHIFNSAFDE